MRKFIVAFVAAVASLALIVPMAGAVSGSVALSVNCTANPETTTITNNTDTTLDLSQFSLSSIYKPGSGEPIPLSGTVAPGASFIERTGSGAPFGRDIYNNEHQSEEGARLHTPYGDLTVMCTTGSGSIAAQSGSPSMAGGAALPKTGTGGYLPASHTGTTSLVVLFGLALAGSALGFGGLRTRRLNR